MGDRSATPAALAIGCALTEERADRLRTWLRDNYFRWDDPAYLASEVFAGDLERHVGGRYLECAAHIVPWVNRRMDLAGKTIVEVGCGSGSSSAAFAGAAGHIHAYDINELAIRAARARCEILELTNATFHLVRAEEVLGSIRDRHTGGVDVVLLYAVLEHQTLHERLDTLRALWGLLRPGGLLVVGDSPNRLTWMDYHTSLLPFFHCLPDELAWMYAHRSPRPILVADFPAPGAGASAGPADLERLARWGRGVSYHEFEIALGDLRDLVVGDSLDPEILSLPHHEISVQEKALFAFATTYCLDVPPAFLRGSLEVILCKPGGENSPPPLRRAIPRVRME